MSVKLRDYQVKWIAEIFNAWNESRSVLFQMPTGTGKTTLFCEIVRKFKDEIPDKKILIVTHRIELVQQASKRLVKDFYLTSGIIAANQFGDSSEQIQVASIQTLIREKRKNISKIFIL